MVVNEQGQLVCKYTGNDEDGYYFFERYPENGTIIGVDSQTTSRTYPNQAAIIADWGKEEIEDISIGGDKSFTLPAEGGLSEQYYIVENGAFTPDVTDYVG